MNNPVGGTVEPGQVISLTQRSAWRREYDLRAGDRALGWLRWRPGRRSAAQAEGREIGLIDLLTRRRRAEGREIGLIDLLTRRRRVVVAGASGAVTLATVDRDWGGSVIRTIEGHALRWDRTARRNHWAIREHGQTLLAFAASQGLVRSSARISVEQTMPERTAVLLSLIGGYLALNELQYEADLTAATAAAAASGG